MSEPIRIAIVVDGAEFQVLTAGIPVEFVVIEYNDEEGDTDVPQDDGTTAPGIVGPASLADDCPEGRAMVAWAFDAGQDGECQSCAEAIETRLGPCDECGAFDESIEDEEGDD